MTIDLEDIFFGALATIGIAFSCLAYLGVGAVLASLLGLDGFAYYGAMFSWPFFLAIAFAITYFAFLLGMFIVIGIIAAITKK
jgi:hypothetical protein